MAKEGQLFSTDTIIGSVIFLVAIAVFYANLRTVGPEENDPFPLEGEFLFNNIIVATAAYDRGHQGKISFLNGSRIQEQELLALAQFPQQDNYTFFRELILGPLVPRNIIADACIFFTNTTGHIIPIAGKSGMGSPDAAVIAEAGPCNLPSGRARAAPECQLPYLYARKLSKPVLRYDAQLQAYQLAELHVLICGRDHAE